MRDARVLLCLRSRTRRYYPGVWDVPGGHVEPGESPAAALTRELDEELGIGADATGLPPLAAVIDEAAGLRLTLWTIRTWSGTPLNRCLAEHERIEWFNVAEAEKLELADRRYLDLIRAVVARSG